MYLQRLNYLSVSYKLSGVYDDITLEAVRTFQVLITEAVESLCAHWIAIRLYVLVTISAYCIAGKIVVKINMSKTLHGNWKSVDIILVFIALYYVNVLHLQLH